MGSFLCLVGKYQHLSSLVGFPLRLKDYTPFFEKLTHFSLRLFASN